MKFYDTCSLLAKADNLFDEESFLISSITLKELESIKTSNTKDFDIKYAARKVTNLLSHYPKNYEVVIFTTNMMAPILEAQLESTNDTKILATAISYAQNHSDIIFVTNDLALTNIAGLYFDEDHIESVEQKDSDGYKGFLEITLSDEEMSDFYSNPLVNTFNLNVNEYLIIHESLNNSIVDTLVWTGEKYRHLSYKSFCSKWFGEVKAIKGDIYQALACDSFSNNTITLIKGPAGSGKTYLSLGYLMSLLDHGKIDKIIIFCNTVATKNSAKLGYLPGTRDEKLLDSQIGNLLVSKFGGRIEVERLIEEEKIVLLPFSDIRGYDTSGMHAGIYLSEAQNLDIDLMKLALQRVGSDSICIIDGDEKTQVDDIHFAGVNNGMKRVSAVFRNENVYGEVELQKIHRSKIAQIAEKM